VLCTLQRFYTLSAQAGHSRVGGNLGWLRGLEPREPFELSFDLDFLTPTGELSLRLGDVLLGSFDHLTLTRHF